MSRVKLKKLRDGPPNTIPIVQEDPQRRSLVIHMDPGGKFGYPGDIAPTQMAYHIGCLTVILTVVMAKQDLARPAAEKEAT